MKEEKIYLIKYIEDNTIEGCIKKEEDFDRWLEEHNKQRVRDNNRVEDKEEFSIEIIGLLK